MPNEKHSDYGPSRLNQLALCPGSARLCQGIPEAPREPDSPAAIGRGLHKVVEDCLRAGSSQAPAMEEEGDQEAVQYCLDTALTVRDELGHGRLYPEMDLDLSPVHPTIGHGTADLVAVNGTKIIVLDWKFVHHPVPRAELNMQTAAYLAASVVRWPGHGHFETRIVNAYSGYTSSKMWPLWELKALVERVRQVVRAAMSPWAPLRPSTDACRYCRGRLVCPALQESAAGLPVERAPEVITDAELARLYRQWQVVKMYGKALEGAVTRIMASGGGLPGLSWQETEGHRQWRPEATVELLTSVGMRLGKPVDRIVEPQPPKMVSPAGLEGLWGKSKEIREAIGALVERKKGSGKVVVVPDAIPAGEPGKEIENHGHQTDTGA